MQNVFIGLASPLLTCVRAGTTAQVSEPYAEDDQLEAESIMKVSTKRTATLLATALFLMPGALRAQSLTGAVAHLHTNDDDRPKDSVLEVSIMTGKGEVLLSGAAPNEAYAPNTDHDIALTVPAGFDKAKLTKSIVLLHFQPKTRDALKYNLAVELTFSDNSKVVIAWDKLFLDQDHRDFTGGVYLQ